MTVSLSLSLRNSGTTKNGTLIIEPCWLFVTAHSIYSQLPSISWCRLVHPQPADSPCHVTGSHITWRGINIRDTSSQLFVEFGVNIVPLNVSCSQILCFLFSKLRPPAQPSWYQHPHFTKWSEETGKETWILGIVKWRGRMMIHCLRKSERCAIMTEFKM
jgi:hypothetical protein